MSSLNTSFVKQQFKGLSINVGVCVQKFLVSIHSKLIMSSVGKDAMRTIVNKPNQTKPVWPAAVLILCPSVNTFLPTALWILTTPARAVPGDSEGTPDWTCWAGRPRVVQRPTLWQGPWQRFDFERLEMLPSFAWVRLFWFERGPFAHMDLYQDQTKEVHLPGVNGGGGRKQVVGDLFPVRSELLSLPPN